MSRFPADEKNKRKKPTPPRKAMTKLVSGVQRTTEAKRKAKKLKVGARKKLMKLLNPGR